jgi:hypothetical protein
MRNLFRVLLLLLSQIFIRTRRGVIGSNIAQYTFACTRTIQNITVPSGANYMYVDMTGAASGSGGIGGSIPGYGARVRSFLPVVPETTLHIMVGCRGTNCPTGPVYTVIPFPGGYNGGGTGYGCTNGDRGGSGGGGASDIRIGGNSLTYRKLIAGGGGGIYCGNGCAAQKGGNAGMFGLAGTLPASPCPGYNFNPSQGGSWSAGGTSGTPAGTGGLLGFGGDGEANGGGGGGGFYGGKRDRIDSYFLLFFFF